MKIVLWDETDRAHGSLRDRARIAIDAIAPRRGHGEAGEALGGFGLTPAWRAGGLLHRLARRGIVARGVSSWSQAIAIAVEATEQTGRAIEEIQVWGHGRWGSMTLGNEVLDRAALGRLSPLPGRFAREALVWLRCCSAFGAEPGRAFARALADALAVRVAGHTYVIGVWQSGTHSLMPGEIPDWPAEEGIAIDRGAPRARASTPFEPRTISALRLGLPRGW